jgi:hypothetical protein
MIEIGVDIGGKYDSFSQRLWSVPLDLLVDITIHRSLPIV